MVCLKRFVGHIANALRINTVLHSFTSESNMLGSKGLADLCAAIAGSDTITKFRVRMPMCEAELSTIVRLMGDSKSLTHLNVSNICNDLDHIVDYDHPKFAPITESRIADEFATALRNNCRLTYFCLHVSQLSTSSVKKLLGALLGMDNRVSALDVQIARLLRMDEAKELLPLLLDNHNLLEISILGCERVQLDMAPMGPGAFWLLQQLIERHPTLTEILVRGYPFDDKNIPDLIGSLRRNTRLLEFGYGPAMFTLSTSHTQQMQTILDDNRRTAREKCSHELHLRLVTCPRPICTLIAEYHALI
jgi:hypothetical protein